MGIRLGDLLSMIENYVSIRICVDGTLFQATDEDKHKTRFTVFDLRGGEMFKKILTMEVMGIGIASDGATLAITLKYKGEDDKNVTV